ncbi:MAG: NUDIX hydrolase [Gammaproteobacteria bacterium]|nr:NUDIX hydrolase [Gammaproteobacteria bacterium]
MKWQPDLTVAAIVERDGRFLLVEEHIGGACVLNQPAGHVEDGEALLAAVCRETREETAWTFTPEWLLGVYFWRNPRTRRTTVRFAFAGNVDGHDASQALDAPVIRTHWLTAGEIRAQQPRLRSPLVLRCIDDHVAGRRYALAAINEVADAVSARRT